MGKVDINKKQKMESLLNSAFELFTTKGYTDTSISDIAKTSGVAKGTFYLYFKDKMSIRNVLIVEKSTKLFLSALDAMKDTGVQDNFEDVAIFLLNHMIDELAQNPLLLRFIAKNLSWGVFRSLVIENYQSSIDDPDYAPIFEVMSRNSTVQFNDPEVMLFMIVELVNSSCYDVILHETPVKLDELKPYLFQAIKAIIANHRKTE